MARMTALLLSRWLIGLLGTLLLIALVWVFGPLLPQLQDWPLRVAVVVVMLLFWAVTSLLLELRRRTRDTALARGITSGATEEAAALREKLSTALRLLKKNQASRGHLYEQPWYVIIGPPGAGKTTALLNAGLHFPLAEEMGKGAVSGVGGTRLCEWWFTEEAVLIDTAGRYTTQDSNQAADRAGWTTFLDLLHRTRPHQPLNGIIVAVALSDIARAPAAERRAHASAIRQRIREVETRLGVRMPVYALFTKTDLIAGFTEFFDDLNEAGRAQVWGTTFALTADPLAGFAKEFRALVERLNLRLFQRLQCEPSLDRRALILSFPSQIASLEQPLTDFLQTAFAATADEKALRLRGAYLTSGTQEGTPVDRLLGVMARSFGLNQRAATSARPEQGRSYFLTTLLREVIFGEAMLVSRNPVAVRRHARIRAIGFAGAAILVAAAGALVARIHGSEQRRIDTANVALEQYERAATHLPLNPVNDADLLGLLPWLNQAAAMRSAADAIAAEPPPWWKLGLSQQAKLAAATHEVYRHALERALLPRLMWRLEAQLRGNMNQPDFLYEATRVYLMLGNAGPLDRDLVHEWMKLDWERLYPGDDLAPARAQLLSHLDALLEEPLPATSLDGDLIVRARKSFAAVSLAERAYSRLRLSAAARNLAPWRPSDALGAAGVGLFVRASGKPLDDGVPGFFTTDGFHRVLLPLLDTAAKNVASESWVLGQRIEIDPDGPQIRALERQIIASYENDYARAWDTLLADLSFVQMRSLSRAAQDVYIIASPESPIRSLLLAVSRQLRLATAPSADAQVTLVRTGRSPGLTPHVDSAAAQLQDELGAASVANAMTVAPGREIDERYQGLLSFIGNGPDSPLDQILKSLIDLQQMLAKLAAAPLGSSLPQLAAGSNPAVALQIAADRLPQPAARWFGSIAASSAALLGGNARGQVAAVYNAPGGPAAACAAIIADHYPFVRGSQNDVSLADFAGLFGPGGQIDGFVNTLLRPYINMAGPVWRPQTADGVAAPVSEADLAQFQRAAEIRDAFFPARGTRPSIRFDIAPLSVDRTTIQATLDLDGTDIIASHGPSRPTEITWPSQNATSTARLVFVPPLAGQADELSQTGPWSLLRLFAHGTLRPGPVPDRYTLAFQAGKRSAVFEVRLGAGPNPFSLDPVQGFRCPTLSGT
jgi:type VI secretion system protein ImpL